MVYGMDFLDMWLSSYEFLNLGLEHRPPLSQLKWQVSFKLILLPFPSMFLGDSWFYHHLDLKRFPTVHHMKFVELYKYSFRFFKVR